MCYFRPLKSMIIFFLPRLFSYPYHFTLRSSVYSSALVSKCKVLSSTFEINDKQFLPRFSYPYHFTLRLSVYSSGLASKCKVLFLTLEINAKILYLDGSRIHTTSPWDCRYTLQDWRLSMKCYFWHLKSTTIFFYTSTVLVSIPLHLEIVGILFRIGV